MSKKYFVTLELDVRDGTNPRKWDWDDLIDSSGEEVIVKHVVCEDEMYEYAMSSEYSYEKEEGLYQAERLIKELQRVRADWKKGLGDPQSFDEWNNHFTAAITKAMKEEV